MSQKSVTTQKAAQVSSRKTYERPSLKLQGFWSVATAGGDSNGTAKFIPPIFRE